MRTYPQVLPALPLTRPIPGPDGTAGRTTTVAIQFQEHVETIGSFGAGFTGDYLEERDVTFPNPVVSAGVALNGFRLTYTNGGHDLRKHEIDTDVVSITGNVVRIRLQASLDDATGNPAPPYTGYINALVIAED
jgi:hypothetical protein